MLFVTEKALESVTHSRHLKTLSPVPNDAETRLRVTFGFRGCRDSAQSLLYTKEVERDQPLFSNGVEIYSNMHDISHLPNLEPE
jgi:hypothetical protein